MKDGILKRLRSNRQIPQKKFAQDIGVSQQTVASWEIGRTEPSNSFLVEIAKYFKVSTDYLLGCSETNSQHTLSEEQLSLIEDYNSLGTDGRNLLKGVLASLCLTHSRKKTNYVTTI